MVAKINKGSSMYGAVSYNQIKVNEGTARIILGNRIITDVMGNTENVMQQTLLSFENYLLANKRTEKPVLHISLNPSPEDELSEQQFASLAKDYMDKMGYGDQPYIVCLHEDIDRKHIHIVSTCVDENGKKINDSYERMRSMEVCRELEIKYGLEQISNRKLEDDKPYLKKVDYTQGDVKRQIYNTLKSIESYRFQSFGEYNALLNCFNINVKHIKGEERSGKPFNGIVYSATDNDGNVLSNPFKSSLFGRKYGFAGLEKRMKRNTDDFKAGKYSSQIKAPISIAMSEATSKQDFIDRLKGKGVDVLFRQNEEGRIYGVTFIDHNHKEVYNGSRMGKEFSANVFNSMFNEPSGEPRLHKHTDEGLPMKNILADDFHPAIHDKATAIEQAFGIFSFEQHGADFEEEEFARLMKRKKKKTKEKEEEKKGAVIVTHSNI
jgi:hypothetical protein